MDFLALLKLHDSFKDHCENTYKGWDDVKKWIWGRNFLSYRICYSWKTPAYDGIQQS
jgi:hypothetical protein